MKHHYWEPPIALYLFLGGLAGAINFLMFIFQMFVFPDVELGNAFVGPAVVSLFCIAIGCIFLIVDLGQPPKFYYVWCTATSIIKWGATLLVICAFFCLFYAVSYLPWGWIAPLAALFTPGRCLWLVVAGLTGFGIMVYTGVMLSTLKAHAFWATPALPILFTVSAISTGCAAMILSMCVWPAEPVLADFVAAEAVRELLHTVDIILVISELVILFIMVLSFLGAGNPTAKRAAKRWISGSYAVYFWVFMVLIGLLCPLAMYIGGGFAAVSIAPWFALFGGCTLRFLVVFNDDRAPLPGEEHYYERQKTDDERYLSAWTYGENQY